MKRLCLAALACALAWQAPPVNGSRAAPACHTTVQAVVALPGRVDSLLATDSGVAMALVGRPGSPVRFLPHDDVVTFTGTARHARAVAIQLPPYIAAPGLATDTAGERAYVLVDSTLFVLDARAGRVTVRWMLDMQAVGWPAAITADDDHVYVAGQPAGAWAAQVEALSPAGTTPRVLWRAGLGLTHAGIWLGLAGSDHLAVFLPSAADVHGTVAILDRRTGALVHSYAVPVPPIAADPLHDRLFLADAGTIRVLSLLRGQPVATAPGSAPLAVDPARGMIAYIHGGLVLADSRAMHALARIPARGTTALAFTDDGALLIGARGGITRLDGVVGTTAACRRL